MLINLGNMPSEKYIEIGFVFGNVFIADTENHLIREAELEAKQVTTIAGTGRQALTRK